MLGLKQAAKMKLNPQSRSWGHRRSIDTCGDTEPHEQEGGAGWETPSRALGYVTCLFTFCRFGFEFLVAIASAVCCVAGPSKKKIRKRKSKSKTRVCFGGGSLDWMDAAGDRLGLDQVFCAAPPLLSLRPAPPL